MEDDNNKMKSVVEMTDEELIEEIKGTVSDHNIWRMESVENELDKRGYDVEEYIHTVVTKRLI
jgi:hypothetical protein